jgi:ABC-type oligopeptide transport system ATPase subunit
MEREQNVKLWGKSTLAQCIAQLYKYTGGKIRIDQDEIISSLWKKVTHRGATFNSQLIF